MIPDYLFIFSAVTVGFLAFFFAYLIRAWDQWARDRVDRTDAWMTLNSCVRRIDETLDGIALSLGNAERQRSELQATSDLMLELADDAHTLQKGVARSVMSLTDYASMHTKLVSARLQMDQAKPEPEPVAAPVRRKPGRPPKAPAAAIDPRNLTPDAERESVEPGAPFVDTLTAPLDLGPATDPKP